MSPVQPIIYAETTISTPLRILQGDLHILVIDRGNFQILRKNMGHLVPLRERGCKLVNQMSITQWWIRMDLSHPRSVSKLSMIPAVGFMQGEKVRKIVSPNLRDHSS